VGTEAEAETVKILTFAGEGVIAPTIAKKTHEAFARAGVEAVLCEHKGGRLRLFDAIEAERPDVLFTIDYMISRGDPARFDKWPLRHATWWTDHPFLLGLKQANPRDLHFSADEHWLPFIEAAGGAGAEWLPLCADPETFRPEAAEPRFAHAVSFLGNTRLNSDFENYTRSLRLNERAQYAARRIVEELRDNPGRAYEDAAMGEWPWFLEAMDEGVKYGWMLQALERAAAETRVGFSAAAGAAIYGEAKWRQAVPGADCREALNPDTEAPALYAASEISLNFHAGQMITACNQRVFDVPAAGGFVLSDYRQDMGRLFAEDEYATFGNVYEMKEQIARYLTDVGDRRAMAERARERVLGEHTYDSRVKKMLEALRR